MISFAPNQIHSDFIQHNTNAERFGDPRNIDQSEPALPDWTEFQHFRQATLQSLSHPQEVMKRILSFWRDRVSETASFILDRHQLSPELPSVLVPVISSIELSLHGYICLSLRGRATGPHCHGSWSYAEGFLGEEINFIYTTETQSGVRSLGNLISTVNLKPSVSFYLPRHLAHSIFVKSDIHLCFVAYSMPVGENPNKLSFDSIKRVPGDEMVDEIIQVSV